MKAPRKRLVRLANARAYMASEFTHTGTIDMPHTREKCHEAGWRQQAGRAAMLTCRNLLFDIRAAHYAVDIAYHGLPFTRLLHILPSRRWQRCCCLNALPRKFLQEITEASWTCVEADEVTGFTLPLPSPLICAWHFRRGRAREQFMPDRGSISGRQHRHHDDYGRRLILLRHFLSRGLQRAITGAFILSMTAMPSARAATILMRATRQCLACCLAFLFRHAHIDCRAPLLSSRRFICFTRLICALILRAEHDACLARVTFITDTRFDDMMRGMPISDY